METADNTKVYFVSTDGQLSEYTIVKRPNMAPQAGCDFLVMDKTGFIYSGTKRHYFPSKKEALENAEKRALSFVKTYKTTLEGYEEGLKCIQDQLKSLETTGI